MIKEAIGLLVEGRDLDEAMMIEVFDQIMGGKATAAQIGAFIVALRLKGETVDEITGAARVMRSRVTPVRCTSLPDHETEGGSDKGGTVLDTCGTGGSGTGSFNISTTVAFVVAACGVKVAKHGNRSVSSACGSADVLETLGVNLDVEVARVEKCLSELGVGFLFAPALHGAMRYAIGPRREIGIRTIFNILGPLTNPAGADRQVIGVYREELVETLARVLSRLGCRRGFVVHGMDGMDEITLSAPTRVAEIDGQEVRLYTVEPEDFELTRCDLKELQGGDAEYNAALVKGVLEGEKGPRRDIVLINSAYALVAAGRAVDPMAGIALARHSIDSGAARRKLADLVRITNQ